MRAAERAYKAIRDGILEGVYPPGERLLEETLAIELGVSRTPVREALRTLQGDGFVEFTPNHGARVIAWAAEELEEMFELRAILEGYAAGLAATNRKPHHIDRLRALADEMQSVGRQGGSDLDRIGELNGQFHDMITEASGNRLLGNLLSNVKLVSLMHRTFHRYTATQLARSLAHHQELVDAIEHGDAVWAKSVMQSHVFAARRTMVPRSGDDDTPSDLLPVGGASK